MCRRGKALAVDDLESTLLELWEDKAARPQTPDQYATAALVKRRTLRRDGESMSDFVVRVRAALEKAGLSTGGGTTLRPYELSEERRKAVVAELAGGGRSPPSTAGLSLSAGGRDPATTALVREAEALVARLEGRGPGEQESYRQRVVAEVVAGGVPRGGAALGLVATARSGMTPEHAHQVADKLAAAAGLAELPPGGAMFNDAVFPVSHGQGFQLPELLRQPSADGDLSAGEIEELKMLTREAGQKGGAEMQALLRDVAGATDANVIRKLLGRLRAALGKNTGAGGDRPSSEQGYSTAERAGGTYAA